MYALVAIDGYAYFFFVASGFGFGYFLDKLFIYDAVLLQHVEEVFDCLVVEVVGVDGHHLCFGYFGVSVFGHFSRKVNDAFLRKQVQYLFGVGFVEILGVDGGFLIFGVVGSAVETGVVGNLLDDGYRDTNYKYKRDDAAEKCEKPEFSSACATFEVNVLFETFDEILHSEL